MYPLLTIHSSPTPNSKQLMCLSQVTVPKTQFPKSLTQLSNNCRLAVCSDLELVFYFCQLFSSRFGDNFVSCTLTLT